MAVSHVIASLACSPAHQVPPDGPLPSPDGPARERSHDPKEANAEREPEDPPCRGRDDACRRNAARWRRCRSRVGRHEVGVPDAEVEQLDEPEVRCIERQFVHGASLPERPLGQQQRVAHAERQERGPGRSIERPGPRSFLSCSPWGDLCADERHAAPDSPGARDPDRGQGHGNPADDQHCHDERRGVPIRSRGQCVDRARHEQDEAREVHPPPQALRDAASGQHVSSTATST